MNKQLLEKIKALLKYHDEIANEAHRRDGRPETGCDLPSVVALRVALDAITLKSHK